MTDGVSDAAGFGRCFMANGDGWPMTKGFPMIFKRTTIDPELCSECGRNFDRYTNGEVIGCLRCIAEKHGLPWLNSTTSPLTAFSKTTLLNWRPEGKPTDNPLWKMLARPNRLRSSGDKRVGERR